MKIEEIQEATAIVSLTRLELEKVCLAIGWAIQSTEERDTGAPFIIKRIVQGYKDMRAFFEDAVKELEKA